MKCLIVRAPYAGQIVDGSKKIEYRTRKTKIRGRIGIIEAKTGLIIGECDLVDSTINDDGSEYIHGWVMAKAMRYDKPVPYNHPSGAVVWVNVELK